MKTLTIALAIVMIGSLGYAAGFSEDFDDGLAQGMGDSDYGWPPGMVPIDGSDPLANPVRNNIYSDVLILPLEIPPGTGAWETWDPGEDGHARIGGPGGSEEAWVLNKLGFGTYETDLIWQDVTGGSPGGENRVQIVLFASHPTQNVTNTLQSGVMIQVGYASDWGLHVLGVLPTDPDDLLWSYDPNKPGTPVVDYRPFFNEADPYDQHNISVKLELLEPGILNMWWRATRNPAWTHVIGNLDVSAYLIEWAGDPASGFTPVGPATEGYWGMGAGDSRYNLLDNLSFVPIPEPTLGLLGLIALFIRRKK